MRAEDIIADFFARGMDLSKDPHDNARRLLEALEREQLFVGYDYEIMVDDE